MIYPLLIIFFLLLMSASFSSFETAVFSLSPLEKHRLKQAGGLSALVLKVLEKPRELLTTVLLGNELVNVAISILAGGLAYQFLKGHDVRFVYVLSLAVATFLILVFGEIIPKNIAIRNRQTVSHFLIFPFNVFSWLMTPLRRLLTVITDRLVALFGILPQRRMIVEEEFKTLLEMGREEGTLEEFERTFLQKVFDFSSIHVSQIMTPRRSIVAIPDTFPPEEVLGVLRENRYSRIPVYKGRLDEVIGILHAKSLLDLKVSEPSVINLSERMKTFVTVRPHQKLPEVFEEFKQKRVHMGIVKDEHGSTVGIITMDDLLEGLFP
ncbi:MAG: HlyC/CorC family transporter [Deltaproteobacteria bacterium]|nr:HlyC/CorC family transporter [Deltaproteobacteria bacterium]